MGEYVFSRKNSMGIIENIFDIFDKIGILTGLIAALFSVLVWIKLRRQNKRLIELARESPKIENFKELTAYHGEIRTTNPYAFAVSLLPTSGSIKGEVESFLKSKGDTWGKMPIEELNIDGLSDENLEDFTLQLHKKMLVMSESSIIINFWTDLFVIQEFTECELLILRKNV